MKLMELRVHIKQNDLVGKSDDWLHGFEAGAAAAQDALDAASKEQAELTVQQRHPFGFAIHEMDTEAFFNMRDWLRSACEAAGARFTGGGIGMGQADIDVEMDGCRYNISIKPLPR